MSLLGNILWIILGGGIILFIEYLLSGLLLCFTIIGIPFGIQCIKLSVLALVPFGKEIRYTEQANGFLSTIMNVIWILVGGIWIAITHLAFAILCAITIIGIPFAKQHMK
ncbi:MAG: YccF domain-containing protein [Calditrichaeota bacterium]|nr:YccF domain-containing protein [Calditrichota bacterium]